MRPHWILFALAIAIGSQGITGLKLVDGGYEDLYVVIGETVPESDELLQRIKEIFTDASKLLYTATHRRVYFKSVKVVIPRTWSYHESYNTVSALVSSTIHIKVGNQASIVPVTVGNEKCGKEGMYTYLHYEAFVLQQGTTLWGKHESVIVHEWGHLRWGLKDEYPTISKQKIGYVNQIDVGNPMTLRKVEDKISFYQDGGMWKPVSCSSDMTGYVSTSCKTGQPVGDCDQGDTSRMITVNCKFCPDMTQRRNASIMGFQYIPSVTEFCDKDDPNTPIYMRHNNKAINEQNKFCDGKSAWEVMREHDDFKNGNNPPSDHEDPPETEFQICQESSDRVRVLVLDTSGSMVGEKIDNLYYASKHLIETVLPSGSWLGIIAFGNGAVVLSNLSQLQSNSNRQTMVSFLPNEVGGGTCTPCGIDLALNMLRDFTQLDSIEESEIILISDGQNNIRLMYTATQKCVEEGVVVHCVAIEEPVDQRLIDIASETGGRIFFNPGSDFRLLAAAFSEIVSNGQTADSKATAMMKNQRLTTTENGPTRVAFSVDEGLGMDTTVTVVSNEEKDIDLVLTGPNYYTQQQSGSQVRTLSLVVPGISEQGQYTASVASSSSSTLDVIITSKPTSTSAQVIRPFVSISTTTLDFTNTKTLPVIYVYIRKGESPVKKAAVQAIVENSLGTETCVLNPLDNGVDPDIKSEDGVYSAVILRECQQGNGKHSTRVIITGTSDSVVTQFTSSGSATIDVGASVADDTPTGSFERVAVADAYTVSNFDVNVANTDETPPGMITDVQVIGIQSGIPTTALTRNYTITWTATGDDFSSGQASWYEMRISSDQNSLRDNFMSAELLHVSGVGMTPNVSGKVERLQMVVSSNDAFTTTTYFAIVAIDEEGNRGEVSNIVPITIGLASQFVVFEEECTDDCYDVLIDCRSNINVANGQANFNGKATTYGQTVSISCNPGYQLNGAGNITCLAGGIWTTVPTCDVIDCRSNINVANGQANFNGKATTYGQTVSISCNPGYRLNGAGNITCLAGGIWTTVPTCDVIDYASKLSLGQIIAIVVACIGLVCLVAVALVIRTFMKTKTKRGSRKIHVRKMPQDYNMAYSLDDGVNSAMDTPVMVTYGDRGLEKQYPDWLLPVMFTYGNSGLKKAHANMHLQEIPTHPSHNDMQYKYEMEVSC